MIVRNAVLGLILFGSVIAQADQVKVKILTQTCSDSRYEVNTKAPNTPSVGDVISVDRSRLLPDTTNKGHDFILTSLGDDGFNRLPSVLACPLGNTLTQYVVEVN